MSDGERVRRAKVIRAVFFDVDGVLTDGGLLLTADGAELKVFHARDGMGFRLLREHGLEVGVISGRRSEAVSRRMSALNVTHVIQGRDDKLSALGEICAGLRLTEGQIAYMGDDVIDIPVMRRVGLAGAPADAHISAREAAHWVATLGGGRGAAREFCDHILSAQGHSRVIG